MPDESLIRVIALCAFLQASEAIKSHVMKAVSIAHLQDDVSCAWPSSMQGERNGRVVLPLDMAAEGLSGAYQVLAIPHKVTQVVLQSFNMSCLPQMHTSSEAHPRPVNEGS